MQIAVPARSWPSTLTLIRGTAFVWIAAMAVFLVLSAPGDDAHAYWAADLADPYLHSVVKTHDAYLYSPAFVQVIAPLKLLPFEVFWPLWIVAMLGGIAWLAGPFVAALVIFPSELNPVFTELWYGNISVFLAVVIVVGLRTSAGWSLPALTKVGPAIGLLWFAGRREWRSLAIGIGTVATIAAVSYLLSPSAWSDWIEMLRSNAAAPAVDGEVRLPNLPIRLAVAAGLSVVAGWRNWPMIMPVAVILALPVFWFQSLTILLAWFRLTRRQGNYRSGSAATTRYTEPPA